MYWGVCVGMEREMSDGNFCVGGVGIGKSKCVLERVRDIKILYFMYIFFI